MAKKTIAEIEENINKQRKNVKYDTKEYTLELLVSKFNRAIEESKTTEIFVPFYQRKFVWDEKRQSKFIESLILGMPIPPIYLAEIDDGVLEIIDGSQRIRTINEFLKNRLKLKGLLKLEELNNITFNELNSSRKRKINNISIKAIVVTDIEKKDMNIRHEIFERLNTGGETLKKMEVTKGAKEGKFIEFIYNECGENSILKEISNFSSNDEKRGYKEEFLIKYFAYCENLEFEIYVNDYLNKYIEEKNEKFKNDDTKDLYLIQFKEMLKIVKYNELVKDISINRKNRLLAIFIGVTLAIKEKKELVNKSFEIDIYSEIFIENAKSNGLNKLKENIELVKNKILEASL
ncbi:DUF262 domain-containing protein [Haliovirga abyssi]|uniref:GmrSD restriction endonucleases N-terminal domain-containing protein n=1 Tax=Haliovirga abyssi TaxID=2996794 RepID=A0AAU9DVZ0_9FUSO|nr:DUF262 domain-containing protein [Haliovirga abyssi]BDU50401.1 hypothetical protein HLVA_09700 [Haliovirga abyssi]